MIISRQDTLKKADALKAKHHDGAGEALEALRYRATRPSFRIDSLGAGLLANIRKPRANRKLNPTDWALEQLAIGVVDSSPELQERGWRADTGETMLLATFLKHFVAEFVPTLYVPEQARQAFPVDNSIPSGARTVSYSRIVDRDDDTLGLHAEKGSDIPLVEVDREEDIYRMHTFARGVEWTQDELEAAAMGMVALESTYLAALNRANERVFDKIAFQGVADGGITGMYNDANITLTAAVTGTWAGATHDQIVADVRALIEAIRIASGTNFRPTRLLMPSSLWRFLAVRRTNTDLNVISALLQDYPGLDIMEIFRADDYDAALTGPRMMAFTPDSSLLSLAESMRFQLEPPEKKGFSWLVAGRQKLGGAQVTVPLTAGYMDGL